MMALFAATAVFTAAAAFGLLSAAPSASDVHLVKIDKAAAAATLSNDFWRETLGVSEIESSWLTLVKNGASLPLKTQGVGFEVLDTDAADKAYFYVRISGPEDLGELSRFGQVRVLDARTALFWSGSAEAREIVPAKFPLARVTFVPAAESPSLFGSQVAPTIEPPAQQPSATPDPVITQLVALVSKTNLTGIISDLQNFQTRYASTSACETSGTYLYDAFVRMGLQTAYESFQFSGGRYTTRNIVAAYPGKTNPSRIVIVGAHYDSYSNQASTNAPGADDNGSGTAAVLEIARILAGQSAAFDYTVKFVCFSAEEWGLYGSAHYAQAAKSRGESIVGVINLDMIAFPNGIGGKFDLVVNRNSEWLADRFASASQTYEGLGTRKVLDNSWKWSDQSSFWDQGFSALCGIEYEDTQNPYYHKTVDTLSTLNMDYATSVARATMAAAADLAQPVVAVTQYRLTIAAGAGGTTNPVPGAYTYDAGTVASVTALPAAGYRFSGWSGDASGTSNPLNISMSSDKSVTANFIRQYVLTIAAGAGGTTNPAPGTYILDAGTVVNLAALPSSGYEFAGWSGDATGKATPLAVTVNSDKSITANFDRRQYTLTISAGAGGTTSPPPGTTRHDAGTIVSVTAAASPNSRFTGWSGDATGTANPFAVTMNADKSLAANFIRIIYPPAELQGRRILNRSLARAESIDVLNWSDHPDNAGLNLEFVRIYLKNGESLTKLADLPFGRLFYEHRGIDKSAVCEYVVLFVEGDGREGDPAYLTIR